jgi:hypothetical protein
VQLINLDLRHVRTNVRLSRAELVDSQYQALCARTERRQRAAKAALARRGVAPRVAIGALFVPGYIAKHFHHCPTVGGVR